MGPNSLIVVYMDPLGSAEALTIRLKIAYEPLLAWSLGPKASKHESDPYGYSLPEVLKLTHTFWGALVWHVPMVVALGDDF